MPIGWPYWIERSRREQGRASPARSACCARRHRRSEGQPKAEVHPAIDAIADALPNEFPDRVAVRIIAHPRNRMTLLTAQVDAGLVGRSQPHQHHPYRAISPAINRGLFRMLSRDVVQVLVEVVTGDVPAGSGC